MEVPAGVMFKTVEGDTDLELEAGAGKSLLVLGLYVFTPASSYVTIQIAKTTVGYFRVAGPQGNHLSLTEDDIRPRNLLDYLGRRGLFTGYPVGEGETFRMTGAKQSTSIQVAMYVEAAAGVHGPTDKNGSQSSEYLYINYGRFTANPAAVSNLYDTVQSPAEFPDFPFGEISPQGKVIRLLGITFSDLGCTSNQQSKQHETTHVKLIRERTVLLDEDRDGLLARGDASDSTDEDHFAEGQSVLGGCSDIDPRLPFMFGEPLEFQGGEELGVYLSTEFVVGVGNIAPVKVEIALIEDVALR